ncbi:MAG: hypothetical protein ACREP4_06590 [Stenotrophomonas sp.]|uniref:hypothetical protein n=1 Tax=Stenotrophomonas sp. TaxID=69392 RepID=UPI003D6D2587
MTDVKTSGRKAVAKAEKVGPEFIGKTPDDEAQQLEALHVRQTQLVEQFGDGLPWHPDHYEAAIRSELRRGCEAFLRAGRYLMVARECAAHGEWAGMLDRLSMEPRQAQRMMEAARRVALLPNASRATHLIEATGSQSKLIELLSLPEDQFVELAETGTTGQLELDDVDSMTRDDLRAAVREARADNEAKDQRISQLSDNLNKEHEKTAKAQRKWKQATPDEQQLLLEHAVTDAEAAIIADLGGAKNGLLAAVVLLGEHCDTNNLDCSAFLGDVFGRLLNAVRTVRDHNSVPLSIPVVHDVGAED